MFDGLLVPDEIQRGDSQDQGTGAALTSFLPLPGGGFYDNYQSRKSPQGIRPLNKSGLFVGTDDELQAYLDNWRAKLGKRGRLTIEFDNGSLRWQWARLQDVSAPRPSNAKGGWLPFALTWITAAQHWRSIVYDSEWWTFGDGLWTWGDGSTAFGVAPLTFDVKISGTLCTVTPNGSIDAPNVTLRFVMTGDWEDLTIINHTTGQQIYIERDAAAATPWLEIDSGRRSIYSGTAAVAISSVYREYNNLQVLAAHGLTTGQAVRIAGTDTYDGDYYPVTTNGSLQFSVPLPPRHTGYGTVSGGTLQQLIDLYTNTTFTDHERWLVLAPGKNVLEIVWNNAPGTATMTVEYDDHHA